MLVSFLLKSVQSEHEDIGREHKRSVSYVESSVNVIQSSNKSKKKRILSDHLGAVNEMTPWTISANLLLEKINEPKTFDRKEEEKSNKNEYDKQEHSNDEINFDEPSTLAQY